ncbi:Gfo/Idh/MocA family oxidoreductase [Kitasatospora sp. MBT63]|uniref:Gfo/Idh/MocA family protein n=1 Tax=Kitasatospora sp. MBT63 TaxID=1444768 RepID=UPI00053AC4F8|nr:Gfo/Idh/MocA family oxidoreductase [Kitasatospora sp. MBT63]
MRVGLLGTGRIGLFHASTLAHHPAVTELLLADADPARAQDAAARLTGGAARTGAAEVTALATVEAVLAARPDAVVVATATDAHADLIVRTSRAGLPTYCEKPIAADLAGTIRALREVDRNGTALQMGFQRRFDAGYTAARAAYRSGELGFVHTLRTVTADPAPPPAGYLPTSGGLYRDCLVHDFDAVRWVTGREILQVYATGSNRGEPFFSDAGDVDTAAALLTLDDGTLVSCTGTRYNGAGYDVRMEVSGSLGQITAGLDGRTPLTSAEPAGPAAPEQPWPDFLSRFHDAYLAELDVFLDVARGRRPSPCTGHDALEALLAAEACELSRALGSPVAVDSVRSAAALRALPAQEAAR